MPKGGVLIVSASTGTGHARAAEALRSAFLAEEPTTRVRHVDLLELAPAWVRATYGAGYELMATRAPWLWHQVYRRTDGEGWDRARWSPLADRLLFRGFRQLLLSEPWELCLCTHFLPCQLAAGKRGLPPFALSITDFTLHRYWVQPGVRRYFVATDSLANTLRDRVKGAAIEATGIPIARDFATPPPRARAKRSLGLEPSRPVALVMGGGLGLGITEMVAACLAGSPPGVQLLAICGRNASAAEELRSLGAPAERLRVLDYVSGVQNYIAAADVVVTKPGGLTCSEAIALGRPLLLTRPIPGQETGNTRALVSAGAALAAVGGREINGAIAQMFADDGLRRGLSAAARRIGRPNSARDVASVLRKDRQRVDLGIAS
ncbi:MAG: hypothetical protein GEU90_12245 [Gemmatimonas sp.]|nr:hypothetical protein [Gemmatimonas sp.]